MSINSAEILNRHIVIFEEVADTLLRSKIQLGPLQLKDYDYRYPDLVSNDGRDNFRLSFALTVPVAWRPNIELSLLHDRSSSGIALSCAPDKNSKASWILSCRYPTLHGADSGHKKQVRAVLLEVFDLKKQKSRTLMPQDAFEAVKKIALLFRRTQLVLVN